MKKLYKVTTIDQLSQSPHSGDPLRFILIGKFVVIWDGKPGDISEGGPVPEEKLTEFNKLVGDWPESEGTK